jgi:hypothetical protein
VLRGKAPDHHRFCWFEIDLSRVLVQQDYVMNARFNPSILLRFGAISGEHCSTCCVDPDPAWCARRLAVR